MGKTQGSLSLIWWGNVHNKLKLTSPDALYLPLPVPTDEGLNNKF